MTRWTQTLEVARWEFNRFVKWRQQFIGTAMMLVMMFAISTVVKKIRNADTKPVTVAVVGAAQLDFTLPTVAPIVWTAESERTEESARAEVANEALDGALIIRSNAEAELVVRKRAAWTRSLEGALRAERRSAAMARLALTTEARSALAAPFSVNTVFTEAGAGRVSRGTLFATIILLFLGLLVLFNGFATLFTGITGEKQQRVTEQMVAIVGPQTWMDGKILGLAGTAVVGVGFMVLGGAIAFRALPLVLGTSAYTLPPIAFNVGLLALIALVTALGVAMWFAFLAAIAATIDDPNSSARTILLFVPMLPSGAAFALVNHADSGISQFLAIFPLSAMAVLPVRLVMTSVPWWEPVAAVALLAATAWFFRRAAGKIFGVGILMYGKEPTLRELARWIRQA